MADEIGRRGGSIVLNARVTRIYRETNEVKAVEYTQDGRVARLDCDAAVNTLPINEAILMMDPLPDRAIVDSARELRFRALVFVGLLVRRSPVLPSSFMYFRQHSFNRISDLSQFRFHIHPEGSTLLVAEISCDVRDRYWIDEAFAKEAVLTDLVREGLLRADEVLETHVFRAQHAYPIYTLGYEHHRRVLLDSIARMRNLETAGRQGRFQYINTHIAIKMGYEAADKLVEKMKSPA
jgi:protoporphyrinogen oxidase